jgi:hypothetical protein
VGKKTKDVAIGLAMPRRVFHNMGYTDYSLDHVTPKGVKELRQAVN